MENEETQVTIVIPAHDEERGIEKVISGVKNAMEGAKSTYEIIVVDDGSTDKTAEIVKKKEDVRLIQHPYNKGYGAALKTGVKNAEGNIVLFIDADAQQSPNDIPRLLKPIGEYDMVVGARTKGSKISLLRRPGKFVLGVLANYLSRMKIPDLNSGFRAIKKEIVMKYMYILPDTFSFTTTITLAAIKEGYNIKYIPIETVKGLGTSKIKPFRDGFKFIMLILRTIVFFDPMKVFLPVSIVLFGTGFIYLIYNLIFYLNVPDASVLLIVSSIFIFFFGLLADQISTMVRR